jgi:hypothetical protein
MGIGKWEMGNDLKGRKRKCLYCSTVQNSKVQYRTILMHKFSLMKKENKL